MYSCHGKTEFSAANTALQSLVSYDPLEIIFFVGFGIYIYTKYSVSYNHQYSYY